MNRNISRWHGTGYGAEVTQTESWMDRNPRGPACNRKRRQAAGRSTKGFTASSKGAFSH